MNNLNHPTDRLKTHLCDSNNNGNQRNNKIYHLKKLLHILELAYEGHSYSQTYCNADITEMLKAEGAKQQVFYLRLFDEALPELNDIYREMQCSNSNMEGK